MSLRELSTYTLFMQAQLFMLPIKAANVLSLYVQLVDLKVMRQAESRIDRILAAHPCVKAEDARLILCYYYSIEWQLPDATIKEVRNTLENITLSLVDAETEDVEHFIGRIKSRL